MKINEDLLKSYHPKASNVDLVATTAQQFTDLQSLIDYYIPSQWNPNKIPTGKTYVSSWNNIDGFEGGIGYTNTVYDTNPNFPSGLGGNGCFVVGSPSQELYGVQIAFGFGSTRVAMRRRQTSGWSSWTYMDLIPNVTDGYKGIISTPTVYNLQAYFGCYIGVISRISNSSARDSACFIIANGATGNTNYQGKITWLTGTDKPSWVETFSLGNYDASINGYPLTVKTYDYCALTISRIY